MNEWEQAESEAFVKEIRNRAVLPANERYVRQGGLMRCCLGTLAESTAPSTIGSTLTCKYEGKPNGQQMIVAMDGVWEWNRPGDVLP